MTRCARHKIQIKSDNVSSDMDDIISKFVRFTRLGVDKLKQSMHTSPKIITYQP